VLGCSPLRRSEEFHDRGCAIRITLPHFAGIQASSGAKIEARAQSLRTTKIEAKQDG
jgi:hypothetical protein